MNGQTDILEIPLEQFISNPQESLDALSLNSDKEIIITDSTNSYTITNTSRKYRYKEPKCCCQNQNGTDWETIMMFVFLCVVVISVNFGGR